MAENQLIVLVLLEYNSHTLAIICRFGDNRLFAMIIKGSAFLWHQVRCLVAVLFMIGQGLESPNVSGDVVSQSVSKSC